MPGQAFPNRGPGLSPVVGGPLAHLARVETFEQQAPELMRGVASGE